MTRLDPAWLDLMPDEVVVHSTTGRDRYGARTTTKEQTVKARIETKQHKTVDAEGTQVWARGKVYLAEITNITPEDDLELPSGERPRIISVITERDDVGPLYEVVVYA